MTRQILIDNIVRQTMILIAQLATSGGVRSPAHALYGQRLRDGRDHAMIGWKSPVWLQVTS